jgi:hypothetical protein
MAIIGILSAVVLPPLISKIEDANSVGEDAKLEEIARALVAGIKAQGRIPNPNVNPTAAAGWVAMATNYSVLGTNELILSVPSSTNETVRRYFLSPALTNFLAGSYTPPAGGWPTNNFTNGPLYLMLVSVSKDGLLFGNDCTTNNNMASNNVLFLQNWAKTNNSAGRVEVNNLDIVGNIAGSSDQWTNRGQFLHVKVVDLKQLFCRVELIDTAAPEDIAGFNVAVAGVGYTPSSSVMVSYFNNNITFQTLPADTFTDTSGNGTWDTGEAYNDINADGAYNNTGALNNTVIPTLSLASSYNARHVAIPNTVILPGTAQYAGPASPPAPTYDLIAAVGPGAGGFLPSPDPGAAALGLADDHNQTQTFYVLKGQAINLFNGTPALDKSVVIQSDVQYKYYNNTWTRVD